MHRAMNSFCAASLTAIALSCALAPAATAQDNRADSAVDAMLDHYANLEAFTFEASTQIEGLPADLSVDPASAKITIDRNGRFAITPTNTSAMLVGSDQIVVFNGESLTMLLPSMKVAQITETNTRGAMDTFGGSNFWGEVISSMGALLDDAQSFTETLTDITYVRLDKDTNPPRHLLRAKGPGLYENATDPVEIRFAIEDSDTPWLRNMVIEPPANPDMQPGEFMITVGFNFDDNKVGAAKDAFDAPELPAGYKVVADINSAIEEQIQRQMGGQPAGPQGPAPNFALPTLEGDTFDLAAKRGKVVILDFWATWCAPCIAGLPSVASIVDEYDGDVILAAVNIREAPDKVRAFAAEKGWSFPILLDRGVVAEMYGVSPIPHTIVIDQQGNIIFNQIGYGPGVKDMLRQAINQALNK